jgi:ATP-dependent Clp protease ATP-binding subunit ClpA
MFERYNEKARRAIFFSRAEASELGCEQIEADFLLLGIAREDPSLTVNWLGANYGELRETAGRLYARSKKIPAHMDLPLSSEAKCVLERAAEEALRPEHDEEAGRVRHKWIGTGHLFLGLLRGPENLAAKMLKERGCDLSAVRMAIAKEPERVEAGQRANFAEAGLARTWPLGVLMRLRAQDGKEIAAVAWEGRVPQTGETISLQNIDSGKAYLVEGVRWMLVDDGASVFRTREVVVTVRDANA